MKSFNGRTALISGASSGIGLALAKALAARGAAVAVTGTSVEKLAAAKAELDAAGARSMTVRFDVTDEQAWRDAARQVEAELGPIGFLGLNAGLGGGGGLMENAVSASWDSAWNTNVMGVLHGLQACLPAMRAGGQEGHVTMTSSIAGIMQTPGMGAYGVTKAAVIALAENLSAELKDTAIGVSVLIPGPVRTQFPATSERHSGEAGDPKFRAMMAELLDKSGLEPDAVANFALDRIAAGALYIFTHGGMKDRLAARGAELAEADGAAMAPLPQFGPPPK